MTRASLGPPALPAATQMDVAPTVLRWLGVDLDPAWDLDGRVVGLE